MAYNVNLPKLGTNMTEALVVQWLKKEGDSVSTGEALLEVETEKATFEVEADSPGVLRAILAQPGETISVAMPLGVIGDENEDLTGHLKELEHLRDNADSEERHISEIYTQWRDSSPASATSSQTNLAPSTTRTNRPGASPAARRLAKEIGVDLIDLARSSPDGKIVQEEDVRRAAQGMPIVIFGAGLGASQVMDVLRFLPEFRLVGLVDDDEDLWDSEIFENPVYGMDKLKEGVKNGEIQAVAISLHSEHRMKVARRLMEACPELSFPALVHPNAYLAQGVVLEDGVLVEAGAVVGAGTVIREGTIVDMGVIISHHCDIGAFTNLAPHCTISGAVKVKEHAVIMTGAVVANTSTIGRNVVVTPGSVVASDSIPDNVIVQGNPARIIGKSKRGQ